MMTPIDAPGTVAPPAAAASQAPRVAPALDLSNARIALAASFTAEGIEAPLGYILDVAGLPMALEFAPYNQVFQELLAPQSLLGGNRSGVNVVLLRVEDFVRDAAQDGTRAEMLARTTEELVRAARQFAQRSPVPMVYLVLAPSPSLDASLFEVALERTGSLAAALRELPNTTVLTSVDVDPLCTTPGHDAIADRLAHIPYTDDYLAAIAIALARRVHLLKVAAHKVLVLDCDNTIWRGVVGEDGVQGIGLDAAFLAVQRFAVEAESRGILVCLASKNAEDDVLKVFDERADMLLLRSHIVSHRVNWQLKSLNLKSLAAELNLGLDSFVFLDDNPVECGLMREALPEVVTLQLLPENVDSFLANLWTFDKASVTQEDLRRTEMYRQNAARETLEADAVDIGEFLASLQLEISIAPPSDADWPRVAQLTQRTNQFNFTTRRRSEAEMRALGGATSVLAVHVRDRFGDYGLVGVVVASAQAEHLEIDTLLLSCRVLGRGVEHAMVAHVGKLAQQRGLARVELPAIRTPKNEPAIAFADSILARYRTGDDAAWRYDVPAEVAAAIVHRAGEDAPEVIAARRADAKKPAQKAAAPGLADRSLRYARLASELTSGAALMQAVRAGAVAVRHAASAATPARSATERALVVLWEEILGLQGLGIDDDFMALGGSSLQAARMIAELAHRRGVTLPLTTILEAPTIRAFAERVDRGDVAATTALVPLRPGGTRKLFLVHDGDGETLLYRNIARRLPPELGVFGIQPERQAGIPLAHLTVEAMARSYVQSIRREQPEGPYLLGGMCAGGLIAFEMAQQLVRAGQPVERVLLMDAAVPHADRKPPPREAQRSSRFADAIKAARAGRGVAGATAATAGVVVRKVGGLAAYQWGRLKSRVADGLRLALLKRVLADGRAWPSAIGGLDFRAIYNSAENRYRPDASTVPALLIRARAGVGDDIPYVDVYKDPTLGWGGLVPDLIVVDVDGGHSSMLQEPQAASLAAALRPHVVGAAAAS